MKLPCSVCCCLKKPKFYPQPQPYADRLICDKCVSRNKRRNDTMITMLEKKSAIKTTEEERAKICLSHDTSTEISQLSQTHPKAANIISDLSDCTNRDFIHSQLSELGMSATAISELTDHFITVAGINRRAKLLHQNNERAAQGLPPLTSIAEEHDEEAEEAKQERDELDETLASLEREIASATD